jgi:hypothetical protein
MVMHVSKKLCLGSARLKSRLISPRGDPPVSARRYRTPHVSRSISPRFFLHEVSRVGTVASSKTGIQSIGQTV